MNTIKTNVYYYVDDVTGKKVYDTEEMRREFEQSLSNLETAPEVTASRFPFEEGDSYFTIEGNTIVESIWDNISEELFAPTKKYYATLDEAIYSYHYLKALGFIVKAMSFIESRKPSAQRTEMIEKFQNFNPRPNISTL
jgi:hypothetical protein